MFLKEEIKKEIGFTFSDDTQFVKTDGNLKLVKENGKLTVYYARESQLARAALLAKTYDADENFSMEDKLTHFDELCFMVDCSRNGVIKVETVKKLIRNLSMLGYASMMLYTEDTYEVNDEPVFGYLRGRYTKDEIKEIDAYAQKFGIEMIPCIQTLAHLNSLRRWYHAFEDLFDIDDILLVGDERVYALIEKMFQTLAVCYSSRRIHIGMDEAHNVGRGLYLDKNGYRNGFDVLCEHLNKVSEIAKKYDFTAMMWSDMFSNIARKMGTCKDKKGRVMIPQEVLDKVPDNVTVCHWNYGARKTESYEHNYRMHKGFKAPWMAVSSYKIGGFTPSNGLNEHEMDVAFQMCKKYNMRGLINCAWGDGGAEASIFSILPSITNVSAKAYGQSRTDMKRQFLALTGYKYGDFMKLEWCDSFCGKHTYDNVKVTKVMLYNDLLLGQLDTEVDADNIQYFRRAINAVNKVKKGQYEQLFKTVAAAARIMLLKYDMGVRLRKAYKENDRETLVAITKEITVTVRRIQAFIKELKTQWMNENKPHGFDIQEYRMGGVICRMLGVKDRIEAYLRGEAADIAELDETLLHDVWQGRNAVTGRMGYNSYELISSVNRF